MFQGKVGELLEVYIFGIVFIVILIPILLFIPIGMNFKEKILIAVTSFLLAEIGLFVNQYLVIWKTMLILLLLAVMVTYIVETRIRPRLADKKVSKDLSSENSGNSPDLVNNEDEAESVDGMNDSDLGDYDLGQEAIDRLLADMNKGKPDQKDIIRAESSDINQSNDVIIHNDDYIEPVQASVIDQENNDGELEEVQVESMPEEIPGESANHEDFNEQDKEIGDSTNDNSGHITEEIDADSEIDFEKQLQVAISDQNDYEHKNQTEDELLLIRSQLFEDLDELEDRDKDDEMAELKLITQKEEMEQHEPIENIIEALDEIESIEQGEEFQKVGTVESLLEELDETESLAQVDSIQNEELNDIIVGEIDEIQPVEPMNPLQNAEPIKNIMEELDEIEPIVQDGENQRVDSIESILEVLDEIEPLPQVDSFQNTEQNENILEELGQAEIIKQEELDLEFKSIENEFEELEEVDEHSLEHLFFEESENQEHDNLHKIMDDIEDITTSEDTQNADTIVEEFTEQQEKVKENIIEDISPTRFEIQRQMLQTMVSHINVVKSSLTSEEYEDLVRAHMQPSLPALEYYTFAYMLIEHYITHGQHEKLTLLIKELYDKFDMYPVIKQQLEFLIEKYRKN